MTSDYDDLPSEELIRSIHGNAPIEVKRLILRWLYVFASDGFGTRATRCLHLVEVSIMSNDNEPTKQESRVVLETTVTEDMVNPGGTLHGGCIAHLADLCTTLPIIAISSAEGGRGSAGVSLNIDVIFHAQAALLRLINTSTSIGGQAWSARIEMWDATHHRLVASATQVKMEASSPKL